MTSHWIFQANPTSFDVVAAMGELDQIMWRTPQYAASIAPGDSVAIWRSGSEAGFIGVGRVIGYPGDRTEPAQEARYALSLTEDGPTTRAPIAVRPCTFIAKSDVAQLDGWSKHQIITAPMGTVFQVSETQWASLAPHLPELPPATSVAPTIPPAFAWDERRKDVYPLPGGYDGYLDTLAAICTQVATTQPDRADLNTWEQNHFGVTETSARFNLSFLLRVGLIHDRSGTIYLSALAAAWLETRDPSLIIGLLHSRARLIGEFLHETIEPKSDTDILAIANEYYGAGWETRAQIRRRRGWLESAGFLSETDDGLLGTTAAGREFLERITLHERDAASRSADRDESPVTVPSPAPIDAQHAKPQRITEDPVSLLVERLRETGNDGHQSDEFERETAEAFDRLGFRSTWLGKAGRTDVLLEAHLGHGKAYRVIVDCKSTGRGSVSQQIDWDTIDEHRHQHNADYAIIVAPAFGGGKLGDRAKRHDTVLLTIDDLSELLVQHERGPLTLETYRLLFTEENVEDGLAAIGEVAIAVDRRLELIDAVLNLLEKHGPSLAPMSARDFNLLLTTQDDLPDSTEDEVDEVLEALSSPMLGLLNRSADGAVRFVAQPATTAATLRILADRIAPAAVPAPTDTT